MARNRRRRTQAQKGRRILYTVIAGIIILIAAVTGAYLYVSSRPAAHSGASECNVLNPVGGDLYACVKTTDGTSTGYMIFELYASETPQTATNFVNLVKQGFYNDLIWHRIVQGFVIQTGDPNTRNGGGNQADWGDGGSTQTVPLEIVPGLNNVYGSLAMARGSSKNSATSQFFINLADNSFLNGNYTVFGQVISGMNVAVAISNLPVNSACASSQDLTCQPVNPLQAEIQSITMISINATTTSTG